jgi:hypothetical protein
MVGVLTGDGWGWLGMVGDGSLSLSLSLSLFVSLSLSLSLCLPLSISLELSLYISFVVPPYLVRIMHMLVRTQLSHVRITCWLRVLTRTPFHCATSLACSQVLTSRVGFRLSCDFLVSLLLLYTPT